MGNSSGVAGAVTAAHKQYGGVGEGAIVEGMPLGMLLRCSAKRLRDDKGGLPRRRGGCLSV